MIVAQIFLQSQLIPHRDHLITKTNIDIKMYEDLCVKRLVIFFKSVLIKLEFHGSSFIKIPRIKISRKFAL